MGLSPPAAVVSLALLSAWECVCVCKCTACEASGVNSGQWTVVRPVAVWGRVGACRVREDATRGDDDRPPLLFLADTSLSLGALDVLDCLEEEEDGREVMSATTAASSVQIWKPFWFILLLISVYLGLTWTMVSRFCRDVDAVLITDAGPMVTTVTWWGRGGWTGAGTMTVAWCVGAGGVAGAKTW